LRSHLRYLGYVLRHKWHVAVAGWALGVPLWRLVIHDWTKFTPAEWGPYVRRFFPAGQPADPAAFDRAWEHHWTRNRHHWQYWTRNRPGAPVPMPETYAREMVADWIGAGYAQGKPDTAAWYATNRDRKVLAPETRALVERLLSEAQRRRLIP
jgi:hypothetical protein